jgi:hypothetical protein
MFFSRILRVSWMQFINLEAEVLNLISLLVTHIIFYLVIKTLWLSLSSDKLIWLLIPL